MRNHTSHIILIRIKEEKFLCYTGKADTTLEENLAEDIKNL